MYESLIEWLRFPFLLHRVGKRDIAGDGEVATPIEINGYRVDAVTEIVDENNQSYLSRQYVYANADVVASVGDMISFPEAPDKQYTIRKIDAYYDGNTGAKSISIFYL